MHQSPRSSATVRHHAFLYAVLVWIGCFSPASAQEDPCAGGSVCPITPCSTEPKGDCCDGECQDPAERCCPCDGQDEFDEPDQSGILLKPLTDAPSDYVVAGCTYPLGLYPGRTNVLSGTHLADGLIEGYQIVPRDANGVINPIAGVTAIGTANDEYEVTLSKQIVPGHRTSIVAKVEDTSGNAIRGDPHDRVTFGFLPGDANGDGVTSTADLQTIIDLINGQGGEWNPKLHDQNRDGNFNLQDRIRENELLNGTDTTPPGWNNYQLPAPPVPGAIACSP